MGNEPQVVENLNNNQANINGEDKIDQSTDGSLLGQAFANKSEVNGETQKSEAGEEVKPENSQANIDKKDIEYQDFVLPEGITLNQDMIDEFRPLAKDLNLNQEQAQKLIDLQAKYLKNSEEKILKDFEELKIKEKQKTANVLGPKFQEELSYASKALNTFLDEQEAMELKNFLDQSGLGNNLNLVKLLINVGKQFEEDRFVSGNGKIQKEKDILELMGRKDLFSKN